MKSDNGLMRLHLRKKGEHLL